MNFKEALIKTKKHYANIQLGENAIKLIAHYVVAVDSKKQRGVYTSLEQANKSMRTNKVLNYAVRSIGDAEPFTVYKLPLLKSIEETAGYRKRVLSQRRKIWTAIMDDKTCGVCQQLDGQIRYQDEPFYAWTEQGYKGEKLTIDGPSAHKYCRCTIIYSGEL